MPITLAIPFGVRCPGYLTPWANQMTYHAAHTPRLGMSPDFNTQKWVTTVTDVMMLNYAGGLDLARDGTQCNTQGVWPCKLPIDSLSLQLLAMSSDLMKTLCKYPR